MSIIEQELARLTEEFNRMELRHEQLMRNLNDLLNNDSHGSYEEDIPDENYGQHEDDYDHSDNFDCEPHFDNQPSEFYYVNECNNGNGQDGHYQNDFCGNQEPFHDIQGQSYENEEPFYENQCPLCGSDQFYDNEGPFHYNYDNNEYDVYNNWNDDGYYDCNNTWDDGNDGYDSYDDQGDYYSQWYPEENNFR